MRRTVPGVVAVLCAIGWLALAPPASAITGSVGSGDFTSSGYATLGVIGQASTCASPLAYLGTTGAGTPFHYDGYAFTNTSASATCVTVSATIAGPGPSQLSCAKLAAYLTFNPADPSQGYLAQYGPGVCGFGPPSAPGGPFVFSFTVPAGASFRVIIWETDANAGVAGYTLDVTGNGVIGGAPIAVAFRSVAAVRTTSGVLVRWRTASEVGVLGFNIYRATRGHRVRVNRRLIPARNAMGGRRYSYVHRHAPRNEPLRYWIQAVNVDGSRQWYGPVRVARAATA